MKLTIAMKDKITSFTVNGTLKARSTRLKETEQALAQLVYDRIYEPVLQSKMYALPDGFLSEKSSVYVRCLGSSCFELGLKESKRVATSDAYNYQRPYFDFGGEDSAVTRRLAKFRDDNAALKRDRDTLRNTIQKMLAGITTLKRLQEEWPEGEEFYKDLASRKSLVNPPAVRGAELVKLMALVGAN